MCCWSTKGCDGYLLHSRAGAAKHKATRHISAASWANCAAVWETTYLKRVNLRVSALPTYVSFSDLLRKASPANQNDLFCSGEITFIVSLSYLQVNNSCACCSSHLICLLPAIWLLRCEISTCVLRWNHFRLQDRKMQVNSAKSQFFCSTWNGFVELRRIKCSVIRMEISWSQRDG